MKWNGKKKLKRRRMKKKKKKKQTQRKHEHDLMFGWMFDFVVCLYLSFFFVCICTMHTAIRDSFVVAFCQFNACRLVVVNYSTWLYCGVYFIAHCSQPQSICLSIFFCAMVFFCFCRLFFSYFRLICIRMWREYQFHSTICVHCQRSKKTKTIREHHSYSHTVEYFMQ